MGGYGSGERVLKKSTVEASLSLDASRLMREGVLRANCYAAGNCQWTYRNGSGFKVNFVVDTQDLTRTSISLSYSWTWSSSPEPQSANYSVQLDFTEPTYGGLRWWFLCPLVVDGVPCERRVAKLYMPPRARYFGCRQCHRLTYSSCQEHDKRVDFLRKHPEVLAAIAANPERASIRDLGLALTAMRLEGIQ